MLLTIPLGSCLSGFLNDTLGRKKTLIFVNIPYAIAWITLYNSNTLGAIYTAFAIHGLAMGLMEVLDFVDWFSSTKCHFVLLKFWYFSFLFFQQLFYLRRRYTHILEKFVNQVITSRYTWLFQMDYDSWIFTLGVIASRGILASTANLTAAIAMAVIYMLANWLSWRYVALICMMTPFISVLAIFFVSLISFDNELKA